MDNSSQGSLGFPGTGSTERTDLICSKESVEALISINSKHASAV